MPSILIMRDVHDGLRQVDLNLLPVLDALIDERHVTRAARRLGLSQPAVSHALARLRELLGDPLLVRGPRGLVATPRAVALAPRVREALELTARALADEPAFDPATARRTFHVATSDYAELILLPRLLATLGRVAPGIELWIHEVPADPASALADGALDLCMLPRRGGWPAGIYDRRMFAETFTCVVRAGHPAAARTLTLPRFCALDHLLVAPRGTPGSYVDDALAAVGRQRRIAVAVPHFLIVPHIIAATDLIATLATRVARTFAPLLALASLPPPVEITGFNFGLVWHERTQRDPAQRWLRDQLLAIAT